MFGSNILETAMGLIFVYLGFSLLCSGLREWIAVVLNTRSRTLKKGILNMLKDDTRVKQVLNHHLVRVKSIEGSSEKSNAPKYISSKAFAQALLEGILKAQKDEKAASDSTAPTQPTGEKKAVIIEGMKKSITKIENSHVKNILLEVLESTEKKAAAGLEKKCDNAKKVIEDWFNAEMELLSAWYKKQTHIVLLVLAILFCVLFNVDTIMITRTLSVNTALRQSISEGVQHAVKEPMDPTSVDSYKQGEKIKEQIHQLGLPIGWTVNTEGSLDPRGLPRGFWNWFYKILGILMSILAVSMGAPFWFDILKKLINISSKPKSSQESSTLVVKTNSESSTSPISPAASPCPPVS
ncbi:MAG: hypothetical protein MUF15_00020 [Acidobacteria bacterium]|jgi:hypothetical protein|nr:hypothetical protein [Acidobacteriota bacterium]